MKAYLRKLPGGIMRPDDEQSMEALKTVAVGSNLLDESLRERFEKYIMPVTESGCFYWTGAIQKSGYGNFRVGRTIKRAHRISWVLENGDIPEGMFVLHKCDVRCCVNPKHLFLGTNADNMEDMKAKGRSPRSPGEANGRSKITEEIVRKIRADGRTLIVIADEHGIGKSEVSYIKRREHWGHIK